MSISTTQCSQAEFFTNPVDIHHSTSTKKEGCCSSGCYTIAYYHVIIQHMEFFQQSIQLIVSSIFYTSGCFHDHRYKKSHITIDGVGTTRRSKSSVRAYFPEIQGWLVTLEGIQSHESSKASEILSTDKIILLRLGASPAPFALNVPHNLRSRIFHYGNRYPNTTVKNNRSYPS